MLTFTGQHVVQSFGAPSIRDMSVQLMRLCRFAGAGQVFWSVGLHSLLVADLLPRELEHYGLLHDGHEAVTNDTPKPMKTDAAKGVEAMVQGRIYTSLGLRPPTDEEAALVHAADMRAVNVEGADGFGPRGFDETQPGLTRDPEARKLFTDYVASNCTTPAQIWELLKADGRPALLFERRLRRAIVRVQCVAGYTVAA